MASEYLLDTNIVIYFLKNQPDVRKQVERVKPSRMPFVTATELLYGAKRSSRRAENLRAYEEFLATFVILYPTRRTLDIYSDLLSAEARLGRPIPANDLWQAAVALQHDAILVTNDDHFQFVPGLRTENWVR
jgi:tRNA(fMet)-specific endonuclease VapC